MNNKDLKILQEKYQQVEEGFMDRMKTRATGVKNALTGKHGMSQEMDITNRHVEDIVKDLIKLKIINPKSGGHLYGILNDVISDAIEKVKSSNE